MVPLLKNIRTEIGASWKLHCSLSLSLSLSKTTICTGHLEPRAAFSSSFAVRIPCPKAPQIQTVPNESSGHSLKPDEHAHSPHSCPISPLRHSSLTRLVKLTYCSCRNYTSSGLLSLCSALGNRIQWLLNCMSFSLETLQNVPQDHDEYKGAK